jgi:16S rRNA (guanine1516-N2)-methyltransferase
MSAEEFLRHPAPGVVVWIDDDGLALRGPPRGAGPRRPLPPPERPRHGREPLLRALGRRADAVEVIDATAGWAVDAGVLAAAGARVTMVERSPIVAALLEDALTTWRREGRAVAEHLTVVAGEAERVLAVLETDVVLLDPFFEGREEARTTAAPLRWLREAAHWGAPPQPTDAAARLLGAARQAARGRVVVKRPVAAEPLAGVRPSGSLRGRTIRFDLYAPVPRP